METRKLFYEDCHMAEFTAQVLACDPVEQGWAVILDATAFYPEGGGQACDLGSLDGIRVTDVQERGEAIIHLCAAPLPVGEMVEGRIDWARRFDLMQQHSGEHIVSGIIHARYGHHNVGFHVSSDIITIDFDGPIPVGDLPAIEAAANEAVWKNLPMHIWYPAPAELPNLGYRTKKALPWPVRIVEVPGYDKCACCGVHVAATGEIGPIKLLSVIKFHQGVRMEMCCGKRALSLLTAAFDQNRQVSQAFSAPILATGEAARKMNDTLAAEKFRYTQLQKRMLDGIAANYVNSGDILHFEDGLDPVLVRELADKIAGVCGGTAAVFSGDDEAGYAFALVTRDGDLRQLCKAMNTALNGRGGGKPICQQGRVASQKSAIIEFFRKESDGIQA